MNSDLFVYSELFPKKLGPKAQKTMLGIIESALRCYSRLGIDNTTFEMLAEESGVTRPLILRYFKDYEGLFKACVKFVRIHYQRWVIEGLQMEKEPAARFYAYVERALSWVEKFPAHSQFWGFFYYECSRTKKYRELNTELAQIGEKRILALLQEANPGQKLTLVHAKFVQMAIAGMTTQMGTEEGTTSLKGLRKVFPQLLLKLGSENFDL
jgi:AcrR family transcriptional regulator